MVLRSLSVLSGLMLLLGLFLSMSHGGITVQDPEQRLGDVQLADQQRRLNDAKLVEAIGATLVTLGFIGLSGAGLSAILRRSRQND